MRIYWWSIIKLAFFETNTLLGIHSLPRAAISVVSFIAALLILRFIPSGVEQMIEELRWGIAVLLALCVIYLPIFSYKLVTLPARKDSELKDELSKYAGKGDEISQVIDYLSSSSIIIDGKAEKYIDLLMQCKDRLSIKGFSFYLNEPHYRLMDDDAPPSNRREKLWEFLGKMILEGIVDVKRSDIGQDYYNYNETFYITEFGRQVIKRVEKMDIILQK